MNHLELSLHNLHVFVLFPVTQWTHPGSVADSSWFWQLVPPPHYFLQINTVSYFFLACKLQDVLSCLMVLRINVLISLSFEKLRSFEATVIGAVKVRRKHFSVKGKRLLNSLQYSVAVWSEQISGLFSLQCWREMFNSTRRESLEGVSGPNTQNYWGGGGSTPFTPDDLRPRVCMPNYRILSGHISPFCHTFDRILLY